MATTQLSIHAPRLAVVSGFEPAGPPSLAHAESIAVIGRVFRGGIRQLAFVGERLLVLAGRGVQVVDPRSGEFVSTLLPELHLRALVVCGARVFASVEGQLRALELGPDSRGELGEALCPAPDGVEHFAGCSTHLAWPTDDGMMLLELASGAQTELRADPKLLGEGPWRETPDRVAFSPEGTWVAAYKDDGAMTIWRRESGEIVHEHQRDTEAVVLLDDGRFVVSDSDGHYLFTIGAVSDEPESVYHDGLVVGHGAQLGVADSFGGWRPLELEPFALGEEVPGQEHHYGSMPQWQAAAGAGFVAVSAGSYSTLHLHGGGAEPRVSGGWLASPDTFSVAHDGRRLVVETDWRGEGMFVDLDARRERVFVGAEGMSGPGISADGKTIIAPVGNNLGPRTVCTIPADGEGESQVQFKVAPWGRWTVGVAPDLYLIGTYRLRGAGYVGVYREGSTRALAKLKFAKQNPWRFGLNREATLCWVDWAEDVTIHDLAKRGREIARVAGRWRCLAMGSGELRAGVCNADDGPRLQIHTRHVGAPVVDVALEPCEGYGGMTMVFSADDSLVFIGRSDGTLEIRAVVDGHLLRRLSLHVGGYEGMMRRAGLIYTLGSDGCVCALGVPGLEPLAPIRADESASTPALQLDEAPAPALPTTRPWAAPGLAEVFELGGRRLVMDVTPEGPRLRDAAGEVVKSLRKRKTDDAGAFAAAKARWAELRRAGGVDADAAWAKLMDRALRTGQSATVAELARAWGTEAGPAQLRDTTWVALDGGGALRWTKGRLTREGAALDGEVRVRLAHPARERDSRLKGAQRERPTWAHTSATATCVAPVETDWASTQNPTIARILVSLGFVHAEDSGRATAAWHLLAPELGAVAVVGIDEEHGCAELSFYAWNGTLDGGAALPLGEVDPQLYAEAFQAVRDAYPHDV